MLPTSAPEKLHVLYDALTDRYGEPEVIEYGRQWRWGVTLFADPEYHCPEITFLARQWLVWCADFARDRTQFVHGWRHEGQFEIDQILDRFERLRKDLV